MELIGGTCDHQDLDPNCLVCRMFMDDPDEDWGKFESGPRHFPDDPEDAA